MEHMSELALQFHGEFKSIKEECLNSGPCRGLSWSGLSWSGEVKAPGEAVRTGGDPRKSGI